VARIDDGGRGTETSPPRTSGSPDQRTDAGSTGSSRRRNRKHLPLWQELLVLLGTALVLAVVVKTFFVQAFYIPSSSMEPTLNINDRILVEKVSYWAGDVHRGDIVVFDDPGGWLSNEGQLQPHNPLQRALEIVGLFPTGGHLVKRVIGVGGDHVRCCDAEGNILVNGVPLEETYLPKGINPSDTPFNKTVPEGHLWVMGDNRGASSDSRAHTGAPGAGFVAAGDIVGKVWAIVWPGSRVEFVDRPKVFDSAALDGSIRP